MRSLIQRPGERVVAPGLVAEERDAAREMAERRFVGGGELGLAPGEEVQLGETPPLVAGVDERHGEIEMVDDREDGGRQLRPRACSR